MKTKTFFLACLLMGVVSSLCYGQLPPIIPDGTKSIVWTIDYDWYMEVSCKGVDDVLVGNVTIYETDLFKNGNIIRGINHVKGKLTSLRTGEVFNLHENIKGYLPLDDWNNYMNGTFHFNVVGENGTHYIGSGFFKDGEWKQGKTMCH